MQIFRIIYAIILWNGNDQISRICVDQIGYVSRQDTTKNARAKTKTKPKMRKNGAGDEDGYD